MKWRPESERASIRTTGLGLAALLFLEACRAGPPPAEAGEETYVVQPGDSLSTIADRYSTPLSALARRNEIHDLHRLEVGRVLVIPRARFAPMPPSPGGAVEAPNEHGEDGGPVPLPKLQAEPEQPIASDSGGPLPSAPEAGKAPFIWPVDGVVIGLFGRYETTRNDGIEIGAPVGTVVWAAADGRVVFSGTQAGYGSLVIILHANDILTLYAHNRENLVREGDQVRQGQPIALVGQSGGASSPGLHFEIRQKKTPLNPLSKLPR